MDSWNQVKRFRIKSDSGVIVATMHAHNHYGALADFADRHSGFRLRWTDAVPSTPYLDRDGYTLTAHRTI